MRRRRECQLPRRSIVICSWRAIGVYSPLLHHRTGTLLSFRPPPFSKHNFVRVCNFFVCAPTNLFGCARTAIVGDYTFDCLSVFHVCYQFHVKGTAFLRKVSGGLNCIQLWILIQRQPPVITIQSIIYIVAHMCLFHICAQLCVCVIYVPNYVSLLYFMFAYNEGEAHS